MHNAVSSATSTPMPTTSILASTRTSGTSMSSLSARSPCVEGCEDRCGSSDLRRPPAGEHDQPRLRDRAAALRRAALGRGSSAMRTAAGDRRGEYFDSRRGRAGRRRASCRESSVGARACRCPREHRDHDRLGVVRRDRPTALAATTPPSGHHALGVEHVARQPTHLRPSTDRQRWRAPRTGPTFGAGPRPDRGACAAALPTGAGQHNLRRPASRPA